MNLTRNKEKKKKTPNLQHNQRNVQNQIILLMFLTI